MEKMRPSLKKSKRKFLLSVILLIGGVVYAVWPLDLIPDMLGPLGWVDDVSLLAVFFLNAALSYVRLSREKK